jgi:hypothetical protein
MDTVLEQLRNDIREETAALERRAAALADKIREARALEQAQTLIAIAHAENKTPEQGEAPFATQREAIQRYVDAVAVKGKRCTAREVAEALQAIGYGKKTSWRSFYASVAVSLDRLVKKNRILCEVELFAHGDRSRKYYRRLNSGEA